MNTLIHEFNAAQFRFRDHTTGAPLQRAPEKAKLLAEPPRGAVPQNNLFCSGSRAPLSDSESPTKRLVRVSKRCQQLSKAMRSNLLTIIAAFFLANVTFYSSAKATLQTNGAQAPDQRNTKLLVGTWIFSFPDGEPNMRIELGTDGRWQCWSPSRQKEPNSKIIIQSGTWFIRQNVFVLRIMKNDSKVSKIPPGIAYTFDVKSISPTEALMIWPDGNREVKWVKVH